MIKVFEVWTPDQAGKTLELNTSYYHDLLSFQVASQHVTFAKGVGLPGEVWQAESPVIFPDLSDPRRFVRAEAAIAAGLKAGLGIPLLENGKVKAVVVLLCSTGVLEIWRPNTTRSHLFLAEGIYHGWDTFGAASRNVTFAEGVGLPGQVWASKAPVIFDDLSDGETFIRHEAATAAGLTAGLGIPILNRDRLEAVVVLLSADTVPLSRVFEIWTPDVDGLTLTLEQGHYVQGEETIVADKFFLGEGLPGVVWQQKAPMIVQALSDPTSFIRTETAGQAQLSAGLGLPILADGKVKATIVILS